MEDVFEAIVRIRGEGRKAAVATIVGVSGSIPSFRAAKMLVGEDGTKVGTIGGGRVEASVIEAARQVIEDEQPRTLRFSLKDTPEYDNGLICGGSLEVFVEAVLPAAQLYVFGAGHVGLHVYRVACIAGFEVTVVDDRPDYATRERFPEAREVLTGEWEANLARVAPTPASFVLIATRGHRDDLRILRWAVRTHAGYVGMLGSMRKVVTFLRTLGEEGVDAAALERVHAPVGLDIGAATPEEIAVSVVAEMIACRRRAAAVEPAMLRARRASDTSTDDRVAATAKCAGPA
jgi:xanthine dehydrogenase accessory factor